MSMKVETGCYQLLNDAEAWRTLATSFPCLARMVSRRELPSDFTAITIIEALGD